MNENIILTSDSYKPACHDRLYPPKTEYIYSYLESRYSQDFKINLFFGLQYILKKYLSGKVLTKNHIKEAKEFLPKHLVSGSFKQQNWQYLLDKYDGYLPIKIRAVPEGTVLPIKNVLLTIENTDPSCYWLVGHLETLLMQCWYPITVATQSWVMKQTILDALNTSGNAENINLLLHDFGARGSTTLESACVGGMAHLVNFSGSDNIPAILAAKKYYDAEMAGFSVAANEHSTVISWLKENEKKAYINFLDKFPTGIVSIVSDSYDIENCLSSIFGDDLRLKVLSRDGITVFRLDSGDPPTMVVKCLDILGSKFGFSTNDKGFKVLNPKIRILQGDGITRNGLKPIIQKMLDNNWSIDNMATFGAGSGLLQRVHRDELGMAIKSSSITINDQETPIFKSPRNDSGKKSKSGRLALLKVNGPYGYTYKTIKYSELGSTNHNELVEVFKNGTITKEYDWIDIKRRVEETGKAVKEFEGL